MYLPTLNKVLYCIVLYCIYCIVNLELSPCAGRAAWHMHKQPAKGDIVLIYINRIISLPAPLLYCVFDRFVLLHKIPNICRFYPYLISPSFFIDFLFCASLVVLFSGFAVNNWAWSNGNFREKAWRNMDKNGKYWGFYVAERSDQRYNTTKVLVRR